MARDAGSWEDAMPITLPASTSLSSEATAGFTQRNTKRLVDTIKRQKTWAFGTTDSEARHVKSETLHSVGAIFQREVLIDMSQPWRRAVAILLFSVPFDIAMNCIVLGNIVIVVMQTDAKASGNISIAALLESINHILVLLYVLELLTRLFVWRSQFFTRKMHTFDLTVVCVDVVAILLEFALGQLPSASVLRIIRLIKLVRAARIVSGIRELYAILSGLAAAIRALFWGMVVILVLLIFWSILAVEYLQPLVREIDFGDCERCSRAFESVFAALITFIQQALAGDSWGQISIPLIEVEPWAAVFLSLVLVSVQVGVLNLVLGAIVDSANERRENDNDHKLREKNAEFNKARRDLKQLCTEIDMDGDGLVTLEELLAGYDDNVTFFDIMHLLDIEKHNMDSVFRLLDRDGTGQITYGDFVDQIHKIKMQESHSLLLFIDQIQFHCLNEMKREFQSQLGFIGEDLKLLTTLHWPPIEPLVQPLYPATRPAEEGQSHNCSRSIQTPRKFASVSASSPVSKPMLLVGNERPATMGASAS